VVEQGVQNFGDGGNLSHTDCLDPDSFFAWFYSGE
jgi:hypothetical protein